MTFPSLLADLGSTPFMMGLVWVDRLVRSPLPGGVWPGSFGRDHAEHARRTGAMMASAMLAGLTSVLATVVARPEGTSAWLAVAVLFAVLPTPASTALVQMPLHRRLSSGCDAVAHCRLVKRNWARTAAWSAHAPIVLMTALLEFN